MKRLIPSAFIAAGLLGSIGQVARAQDTMPNSEYRQNYPDQRTYRGSYSDQGTYRGSYGNWGLLGLCGLFGLLGARSTGTTFGQRPIHQPS